MTFEMVRVHGDRILMSWEDDRGALLREIEVLKKANRKQERTKEIILQEFKLIKEQHAAAMSRRVRSEEEVEAQSIPSNKRHRAVDIQQAAAVDGQLNTVTPVRSRATNAGKNILPASTSAEPVPENQPSEKADEPASAHKPKGWIPENVPVAPVAKEVGPSRKRSVREQLPGHTCLECARYIANLRAVGLLTSEEEEREMLNACSRHKSTAGPPPDTPDGFWSLTVHTPEQWKHD